MPGRERTRRSRTKKKKTREVKLDNNKTEKLILNVQFS